MPPSIVTLLLWMLPNFDCVLRGFHSQIILTGWNRGFCHSKRRCTVFPAYALASYGSSDLPRKQKFVHDDYLYIASFQSCQRKPCFETPCCRGHKSTCPCLRGCPCGGSRRLDRCTLHLVDCAFPSFYFDICNETNKHQTEQNKSKWLPMWRLKALGSLHSSPSWLSNSADLFCLL